MSSLFDGLEHKSELMYRKEQLSEARQKQVLISSLLGASLILVGTLALNLRSKRKVYSPTRQAYKTQKRASRSKIKE